MFGHQNVPYWPPRRWFLLKNHRKNNIFWNPKISRLQAKSSPSGSHVGVFRGHLGASPGHLGAWWGHLDYSWGPHGSSWVLLGDSWATLGPLLGPCWITLGSRKAFLQSSGASWSHLGASCCILESSGSHFCLILEPSGINFIHFWNHLASISNYLGSISHFYAGDCFEQQPFIHLIVDLASHDVLL